MIPPAQIDHCLDELFRLLDEGTIQAIVDQPVDRALSSFPSPGDAPFSRQLLHASIADLVRHLYRRGLRLPRDLSPAQALAEAISILDITYQGAQARGYEGACLDASTQGLSPVLSQLAEAVKAIERHRYQRLILFSYIDSKPWAFQQEMTRRLICRYQDNLPPPLLKLPLAELTIALKELIATLLAVEAAVRQQAASPAISVFR